MWCNPATEAEHMVGEVGGSDLSRLWWLTLSSIRECTQKMSKTHQSLQSEILEYCAPIQEHNLAASRARAHRPVELLRWLSTATIHARCIPTLQERSTRESEGEPTETYT